MCPYKRVLSRKNKPLWITTEIYRLIRERKRRLKLYRETGCYEILKMVHEMRNTVNASVDKAKADFIKCKLKQNTGKPRKFWQSINSLIKDSVDIDIDNIVFRDPSSDTLISKENIPDFLNSFFATIAENTRGPDRDICNNVENDLYPGDLPGLDLSPVTVETVLNLVDHMDLNMSSCVTGINMKICKLMVKHFPEKWAKLYSNSLFLGIFPRDWACSTVTLLPKTGDMTNPGNWRPISQTCIFAKLLERIVHREFLEYLTTNRILSQYQYGFLPNRSTQEAVFELSKVMYSSINNRKIMGLIYLDVAKAFNCIHHEILYTKLEKIGCSNRFITWM